MAQEDLVEVCKSMQEDEIAVLDVSHHLKCGMMKR